MTLDKPDYLTHQLYTASKSDRIRKARIRGWVLSTVIFLLLAFLFFQSDNNFLGYYFLALSPVSLFLYPMYFRWKYRKHFEKYIGDTYKNRFGEPCTIEIGNDVIVTRDKTGEAKINTSEIEELNEIKDFYFIKMKTGVSLIISKVKTGANELSVIEKQLYELVKTKGIKHNVELDWKWR